MFKILLTEELVGAVERAAKVCPSKGVTVRENAVLLKGVKRDRRTYVYTVSCNRWCRCVIDGETEDFEVCIDKNAAKAIFPFYIGCEITEKGRNFVINAPTGGVKLTMFDAEEFVMPNFLEESKESAYDLNSFRKALGVVADNVIDPVKSEVNKNSNVVSVTLFEDKISALSFGPATVSRATYQYPEEYFSEEKKLLFNYIVMSSILNETYSEGDKFYFAETDKVQQYRKDGVTVCASKVHLSDESFAKLNAAGETFLKAERKWCKIHTTTFKNIVDKFVVFEKVTTDRGHRFPLQIKSKSDGLYLDIPSKSGEIRDVVPAVDGINIETQSNVNLDYFNQFARSFANANANEHSKKEMKVINFTLGDDITQPIILKGFGVDEDGNECSIEHLALKIRVK